MNKRMNHWSPRMLLFTSLGALLLGVVTAQLLRGPPQAQDPVDDSPPDWRLPELADLEGTQTASRILAREPWVDPGESAERDDEQVRQSAETEAEAARSSEALRAANRWRFAGSVGRGGQLHAVFRAGDGRTRHLVDGEEIEPGVRVVELEPNRAVISLPRELLRQLDDDVASGQTDRTDLADGTIRLQLFRETEFSLYDGEAAGSDQAANDQQQ